MKIPKLQFSLATIFIAFIGMAIVMSFYRQQAFVDERVHFHSFHRAQAESRIRDKTLQVQVIQQGWTTCGHAIASASRSKSLTSPLS